MRYLPGNAQHIGARSSQQDWFGFADPEDRAFIAHAGFLAIVCDGMGGMEYGDAASRTAVRAFMDAYKTKTPEETIPAALERSVREANRQVVELAHSLGLAEGVGTTLVAAALKDTSLYFVSVGDSGLFHASEGHVQTVNRPHIFANMLEQAVARGSISREEADAHPERESLTSFIGATRLEEIDRNEEPWPLRDGDTILLASDGMFKTLDPDEIVGALQGDPQQWAEALVSRTLAKQREYQDNVTVLSVTVESDERAAMPRTILVVPPPAPAADADTDSREIPKTLKLASDGVVASAPPSAPPVPPPEMASDGTHPSGMLPVAQPPARAAAPVAAPPPRAWVRWVVLLLLIAAAAGAWWWMKHRKPAPPAIETRPERRVQAAPAQSPPAPDAQTAAPDAPAPTQLANPPRPAPPALPRSEAPEAVPLDQSKESRAIKKRGSSQK